MGSNQTKQQNTYLPQQMPVADGSKYSAFQWDQHHQQQQGLGPTGKR
jgi:hypothetical protein